MLCRAAAIVGLLGFAAIPAYAASPADPGRFAADALVAQGCTAREAGHNLFFVSCPDAPMVRIMQMPLAAPPDSKNQTLSPNRVGPRR